MSEERSQRFHLLEVRRDLCSGSELLRFRLSAQPGGSPREFEPLQLVRSPDEIFADRLKRLGVRQSTNPENAAASTLAIAEACARDLLPVGLRIQLRELAERGGPLVIASVLPTIPWELLSLAAPGGEPPQGAPLLGEAFAVVRQIAGGDPIRAFPLRQLKVAMAGVAGLPSAEIEAQQVLDLLGPERSHRVRGDRLGLLAALADSEADAWHLIGHASARGVDPGAWFLAIDDDEDPLEAGVMARAAAPSFRLRRPLVFLNACSTGRVGSGIRGADGWATQMLEAGAGAFVGPQWEVHDRAAAVFAELFYREVLGGVTLGEAARRARVAFHAQRPGDSSALAYAVFADPGAVCAERAAGARPVTQKYRRAAPVPAETELLTRFYGGGHCLVTGEENAGWYPLDGRIGDASFENLVPLADRLGAVLSRVRRRSARGAALSAQRELPAELSPEHLGTRAKLLFGTWEVHRAYGCARLAYWVSSRVLGQPFERSIRFACDALYFGRQDPRERVVHDVLDRDLGPAVEACGAISTDVVLLLLQSLAGLLGEHGRVDTAEALYRIMDSLLARSGEAIRDPLLAGAFRRRLATVRAALLSNRFAVDRGFDEVEEAHGSDPNLRIGLLNSRAWSYLDRGEHRDAYKLIDRDCRAMLRRIEAGGGRIEPGAMSVWNAAELLLNYAVALTHVQPRDWHELRRRTLHAAARLFALSGLRAYVWRQGVWIAGETIERAEGDLGEHSIPVPRELSERLEKKVEALAQAVCRKAGLVG